MLKAVTYLQDIRASSQIGLSSAAHVWGFVVIGLQSALFNLTEVTAAF